MMTNAQLATASLDDIVFDGRNRQYGAYQLRASYQRHMTRALIIATAMFALLLAFPVLARILKTDAPPIAVMHPVKIEVIAPPLDKKVVVTPAVALPKTVAPPVQQHVATTRFTQWKPVPDDQATEKVPDQEALANATVGAVTHSGPSDPDAVIEPIEQPAETAGIVAERPYTYVEQMPQLPGGGGQLAIVAAIQRAVRYPGLALRNGVEGRVFVSFVVDPKGDVIDVQIVKGLGSGLDEETIRAIKTLPRFIPGRQNGRDVSVAFTVPITYKIQ